jgi:TRAP-type C4-dicarboxylate transport system permease small subunit
MLRYSTAMSLPVLVLVLFLLIIWFGGNWIYNNCIIKGFKIYDLAHRL